VDLRLIWFWKEVHELCLDLEQEWGEEVVYRMKAEEMWEDPKVIDNWLRWNGYVQADRLPGVLVDAIARGPINKSKKKSKWAKPKEQYLQETCGELLKEFGYEAG